ncbi:MAG: glutathione S-transferase family protein [Deltaproteobacteria bacterium HGW-Deltaproteobacteria-14]|jgi:glutathione S-transferase|nr:MAG: glutathione S-transferase family protein [Deltaproteobacteria bacterium HGW-Deltaproteobacteria-14]
MSVVLYHHPFTRAAGVVGQLEEVGCDYTLEFVDLATGRHKQADFRSRNPMGKVPVLVDGDVTVTESAAIGLYLADRYAPGRLAPALDDPRRGTYLRWSFFAPSVVEPAAMAHKAGWEVQAAQAGWGTYGEVLDTMEAAIGAGPWLLGEQFSMADLIFGGTLRYMLMFGLVESRASFVAYAARLAERPALVRAEARNQAVAAERGIGR